MILFWTDMANEKIYGKDKEVDMSEREEKFDDKGNYCIKYCR